MSSIFVNTSSDRQAKERPDRLENPPGSMRNAADNEKLSWKEERKVVNQEPLSSSQNYPSMNVLTANQKFVSNSRKRYVLEHSSYFILPLTYWFRYESLINMGAMQLIKILSGYTELDHLNYLLIYNQLLTDRFKLGACYVTYIFE